MSSRYQYILLRYVVLLIRVYMRRKVGAAVIAKKAALNGQPRVIPLVLTSVCVSLTSSTDRAW
eukprot:12915614-Prorocentrum_lima.AAC.1